MAWSSLNSMCGFKLAKCRFGGHSRYCKDNRHFANPQAPAAPSRWPTLVFTAQSTSSERRPSPSTCPKAPVSIGSPSGVPVPWHSTPLRDEPESPACSRAARMTLCCDGPLGAVSVELRPSWLTARPCTRACAPPTASNGEGSKKKAPHPSPRAKPSAEASKVRQRPVFDNSLAFAKATKGSAIKFSCAPVQRAEGEEPARSLPRATSAATRDEEQAVSMQALKPWSPKMYEILFAAIDACVPVPV
mmetsp:Transcript_94959/g.307162  ORF Transcript_94959/g.307162 Transcript_94959/m.307162 type:complete len:246 (+) Transcript_94959:561-1298(+)